MRPCISLIVYQRCSQWPSAIRQRLRLSVLLLKVPDTCLHAGFESAPCPLHLSQDLIRIDAALLCCVRDWSW